MTNNEKNILTLKELKGMILEMTKKEISKTMTSGHLLEEQVNSQFDKLRDKEEFITWIMKYWFNPAKNSDKPWWPREKEITPDNVLEFLSDPKSRFPLSPRELVDDWFLKKTLKRDIKAIKDTDLDAMTPKGKKEKVYKSGEQALKDIGKEIGGLTAAMINKLEKSGLEKLFNLMGAKQIVNMSEVELESLLIGVFEKVDKVRKEVALEFATNLKKFGTNVKDFIKDLLKKGIITAVDINIMEPREIEMLVYLTSKSLEEIVEYLRGDITKDDNRIKSFQAAVAHKLFPGKKKGRPLKKASE